MITKYGFGNSLATLAAIYNLFLIRQRVIKNAIFLTKSNNPRVVKLMCGVVGAVYFAGLYICWKIPPFLGEVAARTYVSTEDVVTSILLQGVTEEILLNNKNLKNQLNQEGLKL
jgi:glycerol-3-phosphate responsive antiterminator